MAKTLRFASPVAFRKAAPSLPATSLIARLVHAFDAALARRSQRLALAQLDERALRDIGLSPSDAQQELRKYPWQE